MQFYERHLWQADFSSCIMFLHISFDTNTYDGIFMQATSYSNKFSNCTFIRNGRNGINIKNTIYYNNFYNSTFNQNSSRGVFIENAVKQNFTGCTFFGNEYGLFSFISIVSIYDSAFLNNNIFGIVFSRTSFSILSNCQILSNTHGMKFATMDIITLFFIVILTIIQTGLTQRTVADYF